MGLYIFESPDGEIKEIFQNMADKHEYEENGIKWNRIFTKPNSSIDTSIDPLDHKKALQKIRNSKGTIGNMQDFSKEQSEKRKEKMGIDPVKQKFFQDYSDKRGGKVHIDQRKEQAKKITENIMIKLDNKIKKG